MLVAATDWFSPITTAVLDHGSSVALLLKALRGIGGPQPRKLTDDESIMIEHKMP